MAAYDIATLNRITGLDAESGMRNCGGEQAYFAALDLFIAESKQFLCGYTPSAVIYSPEIRERFLAEVEGIQTRYLSLGMARSSLYDLIDAVQNDRMETLSDCLLVFLTETDIMKATLMAAQTTTQTTTQTPTRKPLILAVDDRPELLSAVVKMLHDHYTVMAMTSCDAALSAIEKHTPVLFLLDIEMPRRNGYELAALIRKQERFAKTPIIFLTAKGSKDHVLLAIKHGGNDYIVKPVEQTLLLEKIARCLS